MRRSWIRFQMLVFGTTLMLPLGGCVNAYYVLTSAVVPAVATPVFSPVPGSYSSAQVVTISDATVGAAIYYTVDGTTPTIASARFHLGISVVATETIRAIAVLGASQSAVATGLYVITLPSPIAATPTFSPVPGSYSSAQVVTIGDTTPGAVIYYTIGGTTPTTGSTLYTGAITVSLSETIQAIAVASGYSNSAVATGMYTITTSAPVTTGQWTWMSGSEGDLATGTYGTRGVASAGNAPGARSGFGTWVDRSDNLWLFGGVGYSSMGTPNFLNDLWSYSPATNEWTWVTGSNLVQAFSVYGTLGVASPTNVPGARDIGATWTDNNGNFWLFGGVGADSHQNNGYLDDLWMFNPTTAMWTWEGGNDALGLRGIYGVEGVASSSNLPGSRSSAASWTDSSGNFWMFGGNGWDENGSCCDLNDLWKFNAGTKQWTWVGGSSTINAIGVYGTQGKAAATNVPGARSPNTAWVDGQGNFWLFGGAGLNDLWMFNPNTNQWTWVSGTSTINAYPNFGTKGVAAAGNTPGTLSGSVGWTDGKNNLYLFGGLGNSATGPFTVGAFNDLWTFSATSGLWIWLEGSDLPEMPGVYGAQGVAAPANLPGSRYGPGGWTDSAGSFWLFGGNSVVFGGSGDTNDLWRYKP
jgi:N-acetylneuraminic acid mutarotase